MCSKIKGWKYDQTIARFLYTPMARMTDCEYFIKLSEQSIQYSKHLVTFDGQRKYVCTYSIRVQLLHWVR